MTEDATKEPCEIIATLKRARDLLSAPGSWTQGELARDSDGQAVHPHDERARSYSVMGALWKAYGTPSKGNVEWLLSAIIGDVIDDWNDTPTRTQGEVIGLLTMAIIAEEVRADEAEKVDD